MDKEGRPVVGDSAAAAKAMDDGSPSTPASYIRLVQHLIETCICYNMNKEECMETLEKKASIQPVVTSTVWKELEKENKEFFEKYKKDRQGEEPSAQKNSSDEQPSAPKELRTSDDDEEQPSVPLPKVETETTNGD